MPYSPVTFDPLPVQLGSARTSFTDAQVPQALALDGNFAKLNTELGKLPGYLATMTRSTVVGPYSTMTVDNVRHAFPAGTWAAVTLTVPNDCVAVLATIGARSVKPGSGGFFISGAATGSSFLAVQPSNVMEFFVTQDTGGYCASRMWMVGPDIIVGGQITVVPQYLLPSGTGPSMSYGELMLTAVG